MKVNEPINEYPKDTVCIFYISWAMQRQDRWMWCAEMNEKIIDYHRKDELIRQAEMDNLPWVIIRHKKHGGGKFIVERSETKFPVWVMTSSVASHSFFHLASMENPLHSICGKVHFGDREYKANDAGMLPKRNECLKCFKKYNQ